MLILYRELDNASLKNQELQKQMRELRDEVSSKWNLVQKCYGRLNKYSQGFEKYLKHYEVRKLLI